MALWLSLPSCSTLCREAQTVPVLLRSQGSDEEEEGVTDTSHMKSEDSSNIPSQV